MSKQRLFHRISFAVKTDVEISGSCYEASLVDISLHGALLALPAELHPETGLSCHLTIHLNDSDMKLPITGEVIHCHDNLTGVKFTSINIESMIHLRRLLELNSADPDQVRSELNSLIGLE